MSFIPARSLYVHIPFCASLCDYCDFYSVPLTPSLAGARTLTSYVERVLADLEAQAHKGIFAPPGKSGQLDTVYVGGGTPSLLSPPDLALLFHGIRGLVPWATGAEVTIEANPEGITAPWLAACKAAGVNRISLGVQSLNDESLAAVHRGASGDCAIEALALLRNHWPGTLSVDLIAGLPAETEASFRSGLDTVLSFRPHHVSLYALTLEPGTPLYGRVAPEDEEMWLLGRDILEDGGYAQYEVSNFAQSGFECRHNLAYWESRSWAAAGAGASGTLFCDDGSALRYTADNDSAGFHYREEEVKRDTALFEYLMMGFRTRRGVSAADFEARFGASLAERIGAVSPGGLFSRWEEQGLAGCTEAPEGARYFLTRPGLLWLNRFLREL
jgi:oxygen-independent coproporphyrinogen-3 oxidase